MSWNELTEPNQTKDGDVEQEGMQLQLHPIPSDSEPTNEPFVSFVWFHSCMAGGWCTVFVVWTVSRN